MPRAPILDRQLHYKKLSDGTIVPLDWNLVSTSLGAMLEPRQIGGSVSPLQNIDAKDAGCNRMVEYNEDILSYQFSTGGQALPTDYSY